VLRIFPELVGRSVQNMADIGPAVSRVKEGHRYKVGIYISLSNQLASLIKMGLQIYGWSMVLYVPALPVVKIVPKGQEWLKLGLDTLFEYAERSLQNLAKFGLMIIL